MITNRKVILGKRGVKERKGDYKEVIAMRRDDYRKKDDCKEER